MVNNKGTDHSASLQFMYGRNRSSSDVAIIVDYCRCLITSSFINGRIELLFLEKPV